MSLRTDGDATMTCVGIGECQQRAKIIAQLKRDLAAANEQVEMVSDIKELLGVNSWHSCYSAIAELKESLAAANAEREELRVALKHQRTALSLVRDRQCHDGVCTVSLSDIEQGIAQLDAAIAAKEKPNG